MILGILNGGSIKSLEKVGQSSRFINYYLKEYAKVFDKIFYFSYDDEQPDFPEKCICLPAKKKFSKGTYYSFALPFLYKKEFLQCDVLRVFQVTDTIPAIITKILWGIPYITTYGNRHAEFMRIEGRKLRWLYTLLLEKYGLRNAQGTITTTKALENYIRDKVRGGHIYFVPNGVDTDIFKPTEEVRHKPREIFEIIFYGRLEKEKNLFYLLDTIERLNFARLRIIGDGSLRAALEDHAKAKNLNVRFEGVIPHEKIPFYLNAADVFVLPSLYEGHPKTLLEAMSCGLPCAGADVLGIRDVIRDGVNGVLFDISKPHALAEKLTALLHDKENSKRLGENARKFIVTNYNIRKLVQREIEFIISSRHKGL